MKHLVKDLDWKFCDYFYEVVYRVETDMYHYAVRQHKNSGAVEVDYYKEDMMQPSKTATGFKTLDQGKEWAFNHHCEKLSKWLNPDPLTDTVNWFKEAKPEPTHDDVIAQMACHFEEVDEMIDSTNIHPFTNHLYEVRRNCKQIRDNNLSSDCISKGDDLELLDALADQIVTAVGVAYMFGFDIIGALSEVNASNWSKFEDGKAVTDENGKIIKGSGYFKPELEKFVGGSDE